jgi:hypothetical protein
MTDDHVRDEQLLQRLGAALVPATAPTAPPPAALQDLHRAIDASRAAAGVPTRRNPRSLTIAVAATLTAVCIAVVAVATTTPRWSRETTTRVTVVTTSPAFGAVVERQRSLERALQDGDSVAVTIASARLRIALANLSRGELGSLRAEIEELLDRADALLQERRADDEIPAVSPPDTSSTEPTTSAPDRTTPRGLPSVTASTTASGAVNDDDDVTDDGVTEDDVTDDDAEIDDDNSGPGNGDDDSGGDSGGDDNSGPGGGDPEIDPDDDSGSGSD